MMSGLAWMPNQTRDPFTTDETEESPASAHGHGQACLPEEREDIVTGTHRHPRHRMVLLINAGSKLPHTVVVGGAESTDTLSCNNEEAGELQQVLPGLQAVRRHDLAPIRLRRHEHHHQGLPLPGDEPLRAGRLSTCLRHHVHGEVKEHRLPIQT
ncbi:hypothetical protein B296_00012551 [Ensete ventricosum]|uniref:Uncharacterized protein n=1 Tax=Ensete ventricosum TaxID=4639 RepID=A0A427AZU4_ENSVE|nr:hypothetical protein B296_00012551 [Ensete ventricosum]